MQRVKIHFRPTKLTAGIDADFYDEISSDWRARARRLQIRRWRSLNQSAEDRRAYSVE